MQLNFKKDILPHLSGVVVFYLLILFYFSPLVFDGKILFQNDILQWEGAAKEILDYRNQTGKEALWTNRLFGGMPAYLVSFENPGDITNLLTKIITLGLPHPVNSLFFGMLGMYVLLLAFKIRPSFSVAGAVAFAFNTFHLISLEAGHNAKIWAICLIPLLLAGIHIAFSGKKILGLALFAFALMLQLKFNHLQITYYTVLIVLIYGIGQLYKAIQDKTTMAFFKTVLILIIGAVLAVGANMSRFAGVLEYSKYSTRGPSNLTGQSKNNKGLDRDYAFAWSQGKFESLTLLVPFINGGGSQEALPKGSNTEEALRKQGVDSAQANSFINGAPTYWGDQPGTGGPIYGGAIMLFLLVLGIIYAQRPYAYSLLGIIILSLLLAWGKNLEWFNYTLFDYLPGYNKFRAVSMALCMALFAIPVLGSLGLEGFFKNSKATDQTKKLLIAFGATGGLALFFVLFAGSFGFRGAVDSNLPDWLVEAIRADRLDMLRSSAIRSLVMILLAAALVWASLKEKLSKELAGYGIALLLVVDLWLINKRYLNDETYRDNPSAQFFAVNPADEKILQDKTYYRVFNLENPFNEARTSYYHNSIGGYHGAKMKRYQELIEEVIQPEIQQFIQKAQEGNFDWTSLSTLNMLNTKYLIAGKSADAVFQNPEANGPAWFPSDVQRVASNDEEIQLLRNLDTRNQALVNSTEFGQVEAGGGEIQLISYSPNELVYQAEVNKSGLAVFSEIYYPEGWQALVDGQEVKIIRANYLLRGIILPQGKHEVVMKFEPQSYHQTKNITVIFQYMITALLLAGLLVSIKPLAKKS